MATHLLTLAIALLLGIATQAGAGEATSRAYYAPSLVAAACARTTPGKVLYHSRYGAQFRVALVDPAHGRAIGTFPGTAQPDARVPVNCVDLVEVVSAR